MSNIIVFCGKKGSGKNTCSNFLHGYQMRAYGIVENFGLREDTGGLVVDTKTLNENGEEGITTGEVDVCREDMEFADWAVYNMWPFIKNYSFAKELKEICIGLFGFSREQAYGTDEQKNTLIPHLLWENMPGVIDPDLYDSLIKNHHGYGLKEFAENLYPHLPGTMSGREFMQFFGTEVMRKMYGHIWINRTIKNIKTESPQIAVVSDCRFKNEAIAMKNEKAKLIYLTRSLYEDKHDSENGFGDFDGFDAIIDNQNMTIEETTIELMKTIDSWGWLGDLITEKDNQKNKGIKKIKQ